MPTISGRSATNGKASEAESFARMRAVRSGPWGAPRAIFAWRHTPTAASSSTSVRTLSTLISLILASVGAEKGQGGQKVEEGSNPFSRFAANPLHLGGLGPVREPEPEQTTPAYRLHFGN
jgi:hypothetical protein